MRCLNASTVDGNQLEASIRGAPLSSGEAFHETINRCGVTTFASSSVKWK
jgi:hypothetical protein